MHLSKAGGPKDVDYQEKLRGLGEALLGGSLMTMSFWSPLLDNAITGAHAIAAFAGAGVGIHGLWRIIRKHIGRARRATDA